MKIWKRPLIATVALEQLAKYITAAAWSEIACLSSKFR